MRVCKERFIKQIMINIVPDIDLFDADTKNSYTVKCCLILVRHQNFI